MKTCKQCNTEFIPSRERYTYCSDVCAGKAIVGYHKDWRKNNKDRTKKYAFNYQQRLYFQRQLKKRCFCGTYFFKEHKKAFCSDECRIKKHKQDIALHNLSKQVYRYEVRKYTERQYREMQTMKQELTLNRIPEEQDDKFMNATYLKYIKVKRAMLFAQFKEVPQRQRIDELLEVYDLQDIKEIVIHST
ncbi:MAG: hypothetical protein WAW92_04790 [Minisyncoccia bacterium]